MAYTSLTKFKFWCQKVIPLIYDDSLSYYEVLCKIRDYINDIITNMDELADALTAIDERITAVEGDVEEIKDQLEDLADTVIQIVKDYIAGDEFIQNLIDALDGDEDFADWLADTIVNNDNFYNDFIDKLMGDENFFETLANNSYFQNIISGSTPSIKSALRNLTDYYQLINTNTYDLQSALTGADLPCTTGYFGIDTIGTYGGNKTKFKAYVDCAVNYFNAKPVVSEVGGITTITFDDTETAYDSFLINKSNFENKNLLFELLNAAGVATIYQIKDGSIASDNQSVSTDQTITTQTQSGLQAGYYEPPKKNNANVVVISFERADASLVTCTTCKRVFINFDWTALVGNIVLPYNTNLILYDDLTVPSTGTQYNISIYVPNNRLGQIVFGILGYCFYKNDTAITNIEVTVTDNSEEINTLKNSCGDGKALVASAITEKGVPTDATDTFQTMHDNILAIPTGSTNYNFDLVTRYDYTTFISRLTRYNRADLDLDYDDWYQFIADTIGWVCDTITSGNTWLLHPSGDANNGLYCTLNAFRAYIYINGTITTDVSSNCMNSGFYYIKTTNGFCIGDSASELFTYDVTNKGKGFLAKLAASAIYIFDNTTNIYSNISNPVTSAVNVYEYNNKIIQGAIPIIVNASYDDPEYPLSTYVNITNRNNSYNCFTGDNTQGIYQNLGSTYKNAWINYC